MTTQNWNARPMDTRSGCLSEDLGGTTLKSEAVERSSGTVSVRVTGREDRGKEEGVDNVRKDVDLEDVHSHDVRRRSSSTAVLCAVDKDGHELGVVVGDNNTNGKGAHNEEEAESVVNGLESSLDVDTGETSTPEGAEETLKTTKRIGTIDFRERTGVGPVTETVGILLGIAANHCNESEAEKHQDEDNLAARQPEFSFTVSLDSQDVEETGPHKQLDKVDSGDFEWNEKTFVKEEVPTSHKAKRIITPMTGETDETTRNRHISSHFGDTIVHTCENTRVDCVGEKQTKRTTLGETTTDTHEESGTNGTTNGNKLDLSVVEKTVQTIGVVGCVASGNVAIVGKILVGGRAIIFELAGVLLLVRSHLWRYHQ
ncbi:hypothetical protein HG531_000510 [Fusarium graminearum]|nr:hypothetical protein HG531_000510 [Fusarium graminearum]